LNDEIPTRETNGSAAESYEFFDGLLASEFAFMRKTGKVVGRDGFLTGLAAGAERQQDVLEVSRFGQRRVMIECVVHFIASTEKFHNLRLFVQVDDGSWKLLAWANEQMTDV
jgi:hypothetical protein